MSLVRQLYDLQGIDLQVSDAEKTLAEVRIRLEDRSELTLAGERVDRPEARLKELTAGRRAAEQTIAEVGERLQKVESRLYGGAVTNPKELAAAEEEREFVLRLRREEEDKLLELMVEADDVQSEESQARQTLARLQAKRPAEDAELLQSQEMLTGELATLGHERDQITPNLAGDVLFLYDSLIKSKGGVAIVRVERGMCQGCRISLTTGELQKARSADDVTQCGSCRRILYLV